MRVCAEGALNEGEEDDGEDEFDDDEEEFEDEAEEEFDDGEEEFEEEAEEELDEVALGGVCLREGWGVSSGSNRPVMAFLCRSNLAFLAGVAAFE